MPCRRPHPHPAAADHPLRPAADHPLRPAAAAHPCAPPQTTPAPRRRCPPLRPAAAAHPCAPLPPPPCAGADIMMQLDDVVPATTEDPARFEEATYRWGAAQIAAGGVGWGALWGGLPILHASIACQYCSHAHISTTHAQQPRPRAHKLHQALGIEHSHPPPIPPHALAGPLAGSTLSQAFGLEALQPPPPIPPHALAGPLAGSTAASRPTAAPTSRTCSPSSRAALTCG